MGYKGKGVVQAVMEKMWWFKEDSGYPEAGQPVFLKADGARPHTTKTTVAEMNKFKTKALGLGFNFEFVIQPAQSVA